MDTIIHRTIFILLHHAFIIVFCRFGEIINAKMLLNDYGRIAEKQWYWLGEQFHYVILHAFVVMPNHIKKGAFSDASNFDNSKDQNV